MTEAKKFDPEAEKTPWFRVTQAPGFATGLVVHPPDALIEWAVPDNWDEAKYGKHFAAYGPSTSFEPLNDAARRLMKDHLEVVKKKNTPKPSMDDEAKARFAKMEEMFLKMMEQNLAMQAEIRRMKESAEEEEEKKKSRR